jgi:hypothetical protein
MVAAFEGKRDDGQLALVLDDAVPALVAGPAEPGRGALVAHGLELLGEPVSHAPGIGIP